LVLPQYGTQKIKTYFEGFLLTTAEGESTIEDIEMETIGSIETGPIAPALVPVLGCYKLFLREVQK
jgi:iron complex outermembrane receptor protein